MDNLVKLVHNDVFTDSMIIADGTENKHESVQRRIRDYEKEFFSLGKVGFQIRPLESGQNQKIYLLNEIQARLLKPILN